MLNTNRKLTLKNYIKKRDGINGSLTPPTNSESHTTAMCSILVSSNLYSKALENRLASEFLILNYINNYWN